MIIVNLLSNIAYLILIMKDSSLFTAALLLFLKRLFLQDFGLYNSQALFSESPALE